ncbi:MAG: TonB family protein [Candidatus Sulfotelmatobacter sp.]
MKYTKILLAAAGFAISISPSALAVDIRVIANSSVKTDALSATELKRIYLEEKNSLDDGTHVEPVIQRGGRVHKSFLQEYVGKSDDDLQTYYRTLVFTGKGSMPKELGSDAEVVAYVAKTKGAIGYVSADIDTGSAKTLSIVNAGNGSQRRLITRVEPQYPETLRQLNIGGTVRLQLTIAPRGNVENVNVLGGNPILAESAAAAAKHWIYSPGSSRSTIEITIPFDPSH